MLELRAPQPFERADVFIAGGISGTADWQHTVLQRLSGLPGLALNPRRDQSFDSINADEQVEWEYHALRAADAILFWFPPETLCPIALFELGVWSSQAEVPLFVGTDPNYARRFDVVKQLSLSKPMQIVHDNLEAVVDEFVMWRFSA